jgi:hypothetical protein
MLIGMDFILLFGLLSFVCRINYSLSATFGSCNGTHLRVVIKYPPGKFPRPGGFFSHVNIPFTSIIHMGVGKLYVSPGFRRDDYCNDYPALTIIIAYPPTFEHGILKADGTKG